MDLLQRKGFWEDLVDCGGSREYILSMPVSDPSLHSMDSADRKMLTSELNGQHPLPFSSLKDLMHS